MVVIRPGDLKGKLTLTVDPKYRLPHPRPGDRPVGQAAGGGQGRRLVVSRATRAGSSAGPAWASAAPSTRRRLDKSGWFVFRGLWPGDRYKVVIEAPGDGKSEPPEIAGQGRRDPGPRHDRDGRRRRTHRRPGRRLRRQARSPARPSSTAATPRGRSPSAPTTSGRFRLDGLFPGTKYAFVRKEGYRFTGAKVDGDADDLTITLLRTDEPPPAWKPGAAPTLEDQRLRPQGAGPDLGDVRRGGRAERRLGVHPGDGPDRPRPGPAVVGRAGTSTRRRGPPGGGRGAGRDRRPRGARAPGPGRRDRPSSTPSSGWPSGSPRPIRRRPWCSPRRRPCRAGRSRSPTGPGPWPGPARCSSGSAAPRPGARLIDEAAADAARLGVAGMEGYARGIAARALAPFDLDRALALVEPFTRPRTTRSDTAGSSPARSPRPTPIAPSRWPTRCSQESTLPDNDPDRDRLPDRRRASRPGGPDHRGDEELRRPTRCRAEAFAWLAVAVAPRDRARAAALIDRALAMPVDRPEVFRSWIHFGGGDWCRPPTSRPARGTPATPTWTASIMRVMATRVGPGEPRRQRPRHGDPIGHDGRGAAGAGRPRRRPRAARPDRGPRRPRPRPSSPRSPATTGSAPGAWWTSRRPGPWFDAQLAALEKTKGAGLRSSPIFRMLDTLVVPPDRREAGVFHVVGPSWRPAFQH